MADKTILILFLAINGLMWIVVADWMRSTNKNYMRFIEACMKDIHHAADVIDADEKDIAKAMQMSDKMIAKGEEYYHKTFQQLTDITEMNISAMSALHDEISGIISSKCNEKNETENRQ